MENFVRKDVNLREQVSATRKERTSQVDIFDL